MSFFNKFLFFLSCYKSFDFTKEVKLNVIQNFATHQYSINTIDTLICIIDIDENVEVNAYAENREIYTRRIELTGNFIVEVKNVKNLITEKIKRKIAFVNHYDEEVLLYADNMIKILENRGFKIIKNYYNINYHKKNIKSSSVGIFAFNNQVFVQAQKFRDNQLIIYAHKNLKNNWLDNLAVDYLFNDSNTTCTNKELIRLYLNDGSLYEYIFKSKNFAPHNFKTLLDSDRKHVYLLESKNEQRHCLLDEGNLFLRERESEEERFDLSELSGHTLDLLKQVEQDTLSPNTDLLYLYHLISSSKPFCNYLICMLNLHKRDSYFFLLVIHGFINGSLKLSEVKQFYAYLTSREECNTTNIQNKLLDVKLDERSRANTFYSSVLAKGYKELSSNNVITGIVKKFLIDQLIKQIEELKTKLEDLQVPKDITQLSSIFPDCKIFVDFRYAFVKEMSGFISSEILCDEQVRINRNF